MSDKNVDFKEIREMAERLLNGKEYFIGTVVDRLERVASAYPRDAAIKQMAQALRRRFDKQGSQAIISQREIGDMYSQVANHGNAEVFNEELGDLVLAQEEAVKTDHSAFIKGIRDDGQAPIEIADPAHVERLAALFSSNPLETSKALTRSQRAVEVELADMGYSGNIAIAAQSPEFVIFSAELDTKRGRIPMLVPSEIKIGSVLLPSYFVDQDHLSEFTKANIENYISNFSGEIISAASVLNSLNSLVKKAEQPREDWSALPMFGQDMVVSKGLMDQTPSSFADFKVDLPTPPEVKALTQGKIEEILIEAGLSFGRDIVLRGKELVSSEIKTAGLRHEQIKVVSEFPGGFVLATHIIGKAGKKEIQVPVEVAGRSVLMPSAFNSGHVAKPFNSKNLQSFASSEDTSFNPSLSEKYELVYQDLYKDCIKNAAYGNFIEVEESLAVIQDKFGYDYHKAAFEDVMQVVKFAHTEIAYKKASTLEQYIEHFASSAKDREVVLRSSQTVKFFNMD